MRGRPDRLPSCLGGCGRYALAGSGPLAYCNTCWNVEQVCEEAEVVTLAELSVRHIEREWVLAEVSRAVRASYPERADAILATLCRHLV